MALAIVGRNELQAWNLHELALQWRGYVVGHRLGRRAGIIYLHLDDRVVNSRQITYRQAKVGQHSEQDD